MKEGKEGRKIPHELYDELDRNNKQTEDIYIIIIIMIILLLLLLLWNQRNKNTTYIFTTLSFMYLVYDLQVNIDVTLIFTDDILTILP